MSWDEHAAGWDEDVAVRAYSQAAFQSLRTLCQERQISLHGARVLDFGCGTGLLTEQLSPLCEEIVAIDSSAKMIEVLREKVQQRRLTNVRSSAVAIHAATVEEVPLLAEPFDLVVCSSVCAFLDDYPGSAQLLAGLLSPGGLFVQWDWELSPDADEPFGLTREQIQRALSAAGLVSVQVQTAFEVPVAGEVMSPLLGAGQAPGYTGL